MRVVLLNPPVPGRRFTNRDLMGAMGIDDAFGTGLGPRFVAQLKNDGTRMPVISLAYCAAELAPFHDVTVLDLVRLDADEPEALRAVCDARPDWIVAASSFAFLGAELRFLERARAATGAQRMLLGYAATHFAHDILSRGLAEAIARGDAEIAARHLARGTLAPGAEGTFLRDDKGETVAGAEGWVRDLDALPRPRWDGFPLEEYCYFPLLKKRPFLTLQSSRGCPYLCHFCPYPVAQGADFRGRSADNVVDEMAWLAERYGVRSVLFRDPTFSMDVRRPGEIARALIKRGVVMDWGIETRLDRMDEPMIELLAEAGCRSCEFGLDPIDEHTRKASKRKGIAPSRAQQLVRTMERAGIATAGLFVIGLPEQDRGEVERSLDWVAELGMSYVNYEIATPFPGTELYNEALRRGWASPIRFDDLLAGDPKLGFNGAIDLESMKRLQDRALARFYLSPRKVVRELLNRDFFTNLRFVATSGLRFVRSELGG